MTLEISLPDSGDEILEAPPLPFDFFFFGEEVGVSNPPWLLAVLLVRARDLVPPEPLQ